MRHGSDHRGIRKQAKLFGLLGKGEPLKPFEEDHKHDPSCFGRKITFLNLLIKP